MKKKFLILVTVLFVLTFVGCGNNEENDEASKKVSEEMSEESGEDVSEEETCEEGEDFNPGEMVTKKPVIYLYPKEEMSVSVKLDYNGRLTTTYPSYDDGWKVIAKPDGTIYSPDNGREYYCLFWEGFTDVKYDFSCGFVVPGDETEEFLEEKLALLGLTEKEANEFIIYWLPQMEGNEYNLISFQDDAYTENARLDITPTPDTIIRVFMAWKGLDEPIDIEPQDLDSVKRTGFTVVEWGGTEVK